MIKFHLGRMLGDRHMNMAELSRRTGISQVSLSRLYHGADRIRFDSLDKICKALNCSACELIEYVPDGE
jgi:putative transcriptional regulator